jgi:hypothetical protein
MSHELLVNLINELIIHSKLREHAHRRFRRHDAITLDTLGDFRRFRATKAKKSRRAPSIPRRTTIQRRWHVWRKTPTIPFIRCIEAFRSRTRAKSSHRLVEIDRANAGQAFPYARNLTIR